MPHNTKTNSDKVSKSAEAYPAGVRCQKCLKHGHWSYQCTNPRKISIRPSRTTIMKRHLTNKAVKLDPNMLKDEIKKLKKSSKKKEEDSSESSSDTDSDSSSSSSSSSGSGSGSSSSDSSSSDSDSDSSSSISSSGN